MKTRSFFVVAGVGIALCGAALSAQAQVLLNFDTSLLTLTQPGLANAVVLTGTIQNTGSAEVFLNALTLNFADAPVGTLQEDDNGFGDTTFTTNVPLSLLAGESYSGSLLGVFAATAPPDGIYNVTAEFRGGATDSEVGLLASRAFVVQYGVVTVPETGTGLLAFIAAPGIVALVRRRKSIA